MRSATMTVTLAAATGLLLLGGCASTTQGLGTLAGGSPPTSAQTGSPGTSSSGASSGVPKVTTPLDTTKYQHSPCSMLTAAQIQQLGLPGPGVVHSNSDGPACEWQLTSGLVGMAFNTTPSSGDGHGLANVYSQNNGGVGLRRLPDIGGQPAVTFTSGADGRCSTFVGATDDVNYAAVIVYSPGEPAYATPCTLSLQMAQAATRTMKSEG